MPKAKRKTDPELAPWPADKVERRPIGDLVPYARNAKVHTPEQVARVAASIREFGWTMPVLVDPNGTLIAGHARLEAAQQLGIEEVPTMVAEGWSDAKRRAYVLADNRLAQADWDDDMLRAEIVEIDLEGFDLNFTGFDSDEIASFLRDDLEPDSEDAEPEIEEPEGPPVTKPGDLWILGDHRLLCGDCRDAGDVERLVDGQRISLAFTSPPYASQRKYDEESGFKPIHPDKYVEWFEAVQANVRPHLADDGSWFVNITEASNDGCKQSYVKRLALRHIDDWEWLWVEEYCWPRPALPLNPNTSRRFKNGWESVFHFATKRAYKFRPDAVRHHTDGAFTYADQKAAGKMIGGDAQGKGGGIMSPVNAGQGLAYPSNVLQGMGGAKVVGHSAAFPVGLPEFFAKAFTDEGDLVFDPFNGSGSTMIAAERTGRRYVGTEISPRYCDLTVRRWQLATGRNATLEDGRTFAEVEQERALAATES